MGQMRSTCKRSSSLRPLPLPLGYLPVLPSPPLGPPARQLPHPPPSCSPRAPCVCIRTDSDEELLPPGGDPAAAADVPGTAGRKRPSAQTRALALSPTGDSWAAATTEGLLLYALDSGLTFDPTDLTEALTPAAFHQVRVLIEKTYSRSMGFYFPVWRALLRAAMPACVRARLLVLRLGDTSLLQRAILSTPYCPPLLSVQEVSP
jgi:hypothetical protein